MLCRPRIFRPDVRRFFQCSKKPRTSKENAHLFSFQSKIRGLDPGATQADPGAANLASVIFR
jgi:hypothetical protein